MPKSTTRTAAATAADTTADPAADVVADDTAATADVTAADVVADDTAADDTADGTTADTAADDGTEEDDTAADDTAGKMTAAQKRDALTAAFTARDVAATAAAIRGIGGRNGTDTFGAMVAAATAAFMVDPIDPASWDTVGMASIGAYRVAVDAAVTAAAATSPREAADPSIGAVMALCRAAVMVEKARRVMTAATADAATVPDAAARSAAFMAEHSVTDVTSATDEALDAVYRAARGGKRAAAGTSDRKPAPKVPMNGTDNGFATGAAADHIAAVVAANGGRATIAQINKAAADAGRPAGLKSDGAIRNAFMKGVEGHTMAADGDSWVAVKDA